jgi:hypothetical protein
MFVSMPRRKKIFEESSKVCQSYSLIRAGSLLKARDAIVRGSRIPSAGVVQRVPESEEMLRVAERWPKTTIEKRNVAMPLSPLAG